MDFVVSVASNTVSKLIEKATLQARYSFCFNKYVKELEIEKGNLQSKIQVVLDRAKDAKKKTHKVGSEVQKWLEEADFLMAKVMELQEKTKKRNKTYCLKHFPNLISRYNLAKQIVEKTYEIRTHNQVPFSEFSRIATLVGMNYLSLSQDFLSFESRKVARHDLLRALTEDEIHMIGLYGMGGSGKTTLATEVGKEAEKFFDKVIFVVVSNTFDVRKIQSNIARQLKLELKEEENPERAQRLFMRLTSGEKFLIILDDVWEKLDFVDIGIPTTNNQMACTILITTRIFHVCELMNCQKKIPLERLNEDDSWTLFQKHAGLFDDHFDPLKDIAKEITKECDGLPIAIAAVACALKGKPRDEWIEVSKTLRDPSWIDIAEDLKSTYRCLRLSYDNLENDVAKSLLLLCSVYPEDYDIEIGELTIIGLGLGLGGEIPLYHQRARTQVVNKAIRKLIDSCLLLKEGESCSYVKMHDLVRDVALWIAKKENKLIVGQLKDDMIIMDHAIRYLWLEEVDKCSSKLNCPELEFLYISLDSESCVTLSKDFFNSMENLRVLIIEKPFWQEATALQFPLSLHLINNLCCLKLSRWELGEISFIGRFERLESLTIWHCSFDELPKCIIQQQKLRILDLRHCKIQRNPFDVIGGCSRLEVLHFYGNSGMDWEDQNKNGAEFFDKISTTKPALESYSIQFGKEDGTGFFEKDSLYCDSFVASSLYIDDFEKCISIEIAKDMMRRAKILSLRGIPKDCKNIIPDLCHSMGGDMNELTCLGLHDSDGIKSVLGHTNHPSQVGIISNLTHLTLTKVKHLKTLYSGHPPQGLFANLESLFIKSCDSLEHILTEDVNEIVEGSEYQSYGNAFPILERLHAIDCKRLQYLMPVSVAKGLVRLKTLVLFGNDELRSVFGQSLHEDLNANNHKVIELSALENLRLRDLLNITSICPENYHPSWPSLTELYLQNCLQLNIKSINNWVACGGFRHEDDQMASEDLLKVVVAPLEMLEYLILVNNTIEVVFHVEKLPFSGQQVKSSLLQLSLKCLPQLRHICRVPKNSLLLQNLVWLDIWSCGNLKQVFPSSILKSLAQLVTLHIEDCNELEEIFEDDDQNDSNSHQLVLPSFVAIYIKHCHKLKCVFPNKIVIPKLKALLIEDASALKQIFGDEQNDTTLEYVLLCNLPSLTSVAPPIALQTVRYIIVRQCPKLPLTSTATPNDLLKLLKGNFKENYFIQELLEKMIKSMDNSGKETTQKIDCQEIEGEGNYQKLTASPNLIEIKKESEDQSAHKQEEKSAEESTISENNQIVISLTHSETVTSTKDVKGTSTGSLSSKKAEIITPSTHSTNTVPSNVRDLESQGDQEENILRENVVKGSLEGSLSLSENTEIISPSVDLKIVSSPPGILDTSSTNIIPSNVEGRVEECSSSLSHPDPECSTKGVRGLEGKSTQKENISRENVEDVMGNSENPLSSENAKTITLSTDPKLASLLPGILVTSTTNIVPHHMKESEDQSAHEEDMLDEKSVEGRVENYSTSENFQIVTSSAHSELASSTMDVKGSPSTDSKLESLLPGILITSSTNTIPHVQNQIMFNPRKSDIEDLKDDDLISVLEIMEDVYGGKSPTSSVPTSKDDLVTKALVDLEDSLKMPLKDIATSEANRLRLQTALNFLSHISLEEGAVSHGVMAIIKSMYKDLPHILSSFKQAHAAVNKFAVLEERDKSIKYELSQRKEVAISLVSKMSEAQEKEARLKEHISRLEKERKDCEDELLSLQDQKRKYIAETAEFKKEIETVKKEKSEMVEYQRNAQQQLFQVDHKWSVLTSQFENNIANRKTI